MAALASTFQAWSVTEGSNGPLGTDTPSLLDNGIRTAASVMRSRLGTRGTIASASTCDLGSKTEGKLDVSGTTGISSFGTSLTSTGYGVTYVLTFLGILTLTNSSSLACIGAANIPTAAGDTCEVEYSASGWTMLWYARKSGLVAAAAFTFGDGTVGAPSIAFTSDTDTGLYRSGANSMVAVANGAAQATFSASGLSATTATFTTVTGTNVVGSTNVRSPNVGSSSGNFTIASATDTYNFDQAGGTVVKFLQDGNQFAVIGVVGSDTFTAFSIPGAAGGAEPYQFGIGQEPGGQAEDGAWSNVFFTAVEGLKVDSASITNLATFYAENCSNALYVYKLGPNPIWRVDNAGLNTGAPRNLSWKHLGGYLYLVR